MAGHSKWKNIMRRKNAQDAKRGQAFLKIAKNIYLAAKQGADPSQNPQLRSAIEKAKEVNYSQDNIQRAIQKATGIGIDQKYEEITYEGYGPGGVAVMVQCLTNNKNRTASNIRLAFSKNGGSLGESGCVAFLFERKGFFRLSLEELRMPFDDFQLYAIDLNVDTIEEVDGEIELTSTPQHYESIKKSLEEKKIPLEEAELTFLPVTSHQLQESSHDAFEKMMEMLESDEDVQDVYHNAE